MQILFKSVDELEQLRHTFHQAGLCISRFLFTVSPNHQPSQVTNRYRLATLIFTFKSHLLVLSMQGQVTERILLTTTALELVNSTRGTIDLEVRLWQAECKDRPPGSRRIGDILRNFTVQNFVDGSSPLFRLRTR